MSKDNNITPPKWKSRLLHWYCKHDLLEEIEGDINEEYYSILQKKDRKCANKYYNTQVFRFSGHLQLHH
jgi:hypothetical protein